MTETALGQLIEENSELELLCLAVAGETADVSAGLKPYGLVDLTLSNGVKITAQIRQSGWGDTSSEQPGDVLDRLLITPKGGAVLAPYPFDVYPDSVQPGDILDRLLGPIEAHALARRQLEGDDG
jgi:hypothetical protein